MEMANHKLPRFASKIKEITTILSEEEVLSLATTITGGLLKNKISSREDALKVILNYSEDVRSILRRKVFTREKLISYLYDKNVSLKLPITKPEIIENILRLWTSDACDFELNDSSSDLFETVNSQNSSEPNQPEDNEVQRDENIQISEISSVNLESSVVGRAKQNEDLNVEKTVKLLAEQFLQWFYKLFNENELAPEHFFPDGVLNLVLVSNGDTNTKNICNDPNQVTDVLRSVKTQYDLFFNPNLISDNVKAQIDPHGLVMIIIGGTLHVKSVCVGVFEQMFALARDPLAENNWKIKRTDLRLTNGSNDSDPLRLENHNTESSDMSCTMIE